MKHIDRIIRWGGLAAVVGLVCAMSPAGKQSGNTKPFKETGTEYTVTGLGPGALTQPFFVEARELYGDEYWSGVIHQFSQNNVGGKGNSVLFEAVHGTESGVIIAVMKYETVANGDRFVMAGYIIPQTDGTYVADIWLIPEQGTGHFAGATGTFTDIAPAPGGYILEGTITTVGATK